MDPQVGHQGQQDQDLNNIHKQITNIVSVTDAPDGGILIKADPDFVSKVTGRLQPYKNFPRTMRPALVNVADYVRGTMIPRTFNEEGPGWRKLSKRSQHERAAQGYNPLHPILVRSGDLFKELTQRNHPSHIEIIKTGRNARIIIGGSSEKFMRNQAGNQMFHIPSRPMIPGTENLPLPDRDRTQIAKIMRDSIVKEFNK